MTDLLESTYIFTSKKTAYEIYILTKTKIAHDLESKLHGINKKRAQ
jgi:hypothetical protein